MRKGAEATETPSRDHSTCRREERRKEEGKLPYCPKMSHPESSPSAQDSGVAIHRPPTKSTPLVCPEQLEAQKASVIGPRSHGAGGQGWT